jgi:hypothetical protein
LLFTFTATLCCNIFWEQNLPFSLPSSLKESTLVIPECQCRLFLISAALNFMLLATEEPTHLIAPKIEITLFAAPIMLAPLLFHIHYALHLVLATENATYVVRRPQN